MLATLFAAILLASRIEILFIILLVILLFFFLAKSHKNILRMAPLFITIGIMTFLLWAVFYKEYDSRWLYAGFLSARFLSLLFSGLLYLSITSIEEFSSGLNLLGVPYPMSFTVSLSFRLVMLFIHTGFTIVEAQRVRGNDVGHGNILRRIKGYLPLLVPLILTGLKKADTLTLALESKGFLPINKINIRPRYRMRLKDWIFIISAILFLASVILLRFVPIQQLINAI
jgi:energy-coupling factor transport system permease protein